MSTSHYCWGKKFGQFTRKCFSNDTFWLPLPIMSKGSRGSLWEYTKFKIKVVKIYAPFQTKTAENHILWDSTFLSSLYEGAPQSSLPPTLYHYLLHLHPPPSLMNCAFKQIQRQNTISMNSCIQYKTKNRKKRGKWVNMPSKNWKWSTNWALMPRKPWRSPWPVSWRLLESIFLTHQR